MFKALLPLFFVGSNAFASESCFKAENTTSMKAIVEREDAGMSVAEEVAEASLKLYTDSRYRESNGKLHDLADLSIETFHGTKALSTSFMHMGNYSVECDGGRMSVTKNADGSVTMKSDGIRADIEGCDGTVDIVSSGTVFQPVLCEAPKAN